MEDYKTFTKKAYNKYPKEFDVYLGDYFNTHLVPEANNFLKNLEGKKILDLGCGSGTHARYFSDKGFDVMCSDISEEMIKLCREKGLKGFVMDVEEMNLEEEYDGIWANALLLHFPREKISSIIPRIAKSLKPEGFLFVSFKEGKGEGYETNHKYPGTKRWFTYLVD